MTSILKMKAAFDGRVSFGDTLLVANNVVIGIDKPAEHATGKGTEKIGGRSKTSKDRTKIIDFLNQSGPAQASTIADHILGPNSAQHPNRRKLVQTIGRMVKQEILAIPKAEKGKFKPKYQVHRPLGRPKLVA